MADEKTIAELTLAESVSESDLIETELPNAMVSSGYVSRRNTLGVIGNFLLKTMLFTSDLRTTAKTIIGAINELFADKNISDEYDSTATYSVGDYCIYQGTLYKCTTAVSTAEAFDSTKWSSTIVTDELGSGGGGGAYVELTGSLTAGSTTITFTDASLISTCTLDVYVDDAFFGVVPTALTTDYPNNSITLTFPSQSSNMPVKVRVS